MFKKQQDIDFYEPLVTIITVVYNGANTIERTIKSVIDQTYKNIEYIIIDGASTDGTQNIINRYKQDISYFVSEQDDGIYDAMNKGIRQAKGDIIGIINSDDWYAADAVVNVVNAFKSDRNAELVYGNIFYIEESGKQKLKFPKELKTIWYRMAIPHPTVFIKRSIYEKYGAFNLDYKIAADYELILRLYANGIQFKYIEYPLAYFTQGGISQRLKLDCAIESNRISCKYMNLCNEDLSLNELLDEMKGWTAFNDILQLRPDKVEIMINDHFNMELQEIVIFGVGEWGKRCYQALKRTNINVKLFADNYRKGELFSKKIVSPVSLNDKDYVLIAVQNDTELIEKQLKEMNVLNIVSIRRLIDSYLSLENTIMKKEYEMGAS